MSIAITAMNAGSISQIQSQMNQVRIAIAAALANGDLRTEAALDRQLTDLGQRIRNLRPIPAYADDRCCSSCP